MAIYPENMDRLDVEDTGKSLSVIENYIRYMCERTEFAMRNMTKTVSAAGVSSAELYILYVAQGQQLAALQSTVNQMGGQITSVSSLVGTLNAAVTALQTAVGDANSGLVKAAADLQSGIKGIREDISDLDRRVTALEQTSVTEG